MNTEQEIRNIKNSIKEIQDDLTELKKRLYLNKMLRPEDFLTETEKADLLNNKGFQCIICNRVKPKECFNQYNEERKDGICSECFFTRFPGNE